MTSTANLFSAPKRFGTIAAGLVEQAHATAQSLFPHLHGAPMPAGYTWHRLVRRIVSAPNAIGGNSVYFVADEQREPLDCRCGGIGYHVSSRPSPVTHTALPESYCTCEQGKALHAAAYAAFGWEFEGGIGPSGPVLVPLRGLEAPAFSRAATADLATYAPRTPAQTTGLDIVRTWAAGDPQGRGMILTGTIGSGKTYLGVAALRGWAAAQRGTKARAIHITDLVALLDRVHFHLQDHTPAERHQMRARLDGLRESPCLLIDDLGTESVTQPIHDDLIIFLSHRLDAVDLVTILTSNLPRRSVMDPEDPKRILVASFRDRYGARLHSRAAVALVPVVLTGDDLRLGTR